MDIDKTLSFINDSFLAPLLADKDITDISYNGDSIFYQHNYKGRQKSQILVSENKVREFIRQIANLTEKQFSYSTPNLDVSVGRYRINAIHQTIGRFQENPCVTFSIRISSQILHIKDDSGFFPIEVNGIIDRLIKERQSIVIGGETGSGKTEFQKYLLTKMSENTRVIIIDNILELDHLTLNKEIDLNSWLADEKNNYTNIQSLVKNALRSNPDWLIVAEARGPEMLDVLNSAMTGHPIITTVHAQNLESMPNRLARMVMMNDKKMDLESVKYDIYNHFQYYFYLKTYVDSDKTVHRFLHSIGRLDIEGKMTYLYKNSEAVV